MEVNYNCIYAISRCHKFRGYVFKLHSLLCEVKQWLEIHCPMQVLSGWKPVHVNCDLVHNKISITEA